MPVHEVVQSMRAVPSHPGMQCWKPVGRTTARLASLRPSSSHWMAYSVQAEALDGQGADSLTVEYKVFVVAVMYFTLCKVPCPLSWII